MGHTINENMRIVSLISTSSSSAREEQRSILQWMLEVKQNGNLFFQPMLAHAHYFVVLRNTAFNVLLVGGD